MCQIFYVDPAKVETIKDLLAQDFTVNQEQYTPYPFSQRRYEIHQRFIDVQFLLRGSEDLYIVHKAKFEEEASFDTKKDIAFFETKPKEDLCIHLTVGLFVVIPPDFAHMPCIAPIVKPKIVTKCVAKIPLSYWQASNNFLAKYLGN